MGEAKRRSAASTPSDMALTVQVVSDNGAVVSYMLRHRDALSILTRNNVVGPGYVDPATQLPPVDPVTGQRPQMTPFNDPDHLYAGLTRAHISILALGVEMRRLFEVGVSFAAVCGLVLQAAICSRRFALDLEEAVARGRPCSLYVSESSLPSVVLAFAQRSAGETSLLGSEGWTETLYCPPLDPSDPDAPWRALGEVMEVEAAFRRIVGPVVGRDGTFPKTVGPRSTFPDFDPPVSIAFA